ncbi:MAG: hypothetical protein IT562_07420 [Alphaproteobacteria bacterium]|nr:hypothetical protein [Alphaproteobacteria bacterium]
MRALRWMVVLAPLALAACGGEDRTVVVNPSPAPTAPTATVVPPGSTVVVPQSGIRVCPPGAVAC